MKTFIDYIMNLLFEGIAVGIVVVVVGYFVSLIVGKIILLYA